MSNEPDTPEWMRRDYVISGPVPGPVRPRVPRQRTLRGVAGYVGDVDLYEPLAPSVRMVDPVREARAVVDPAVLAAITPELALELEQWVDSGGKLDTVTMVIRNAIGVLLYGPVEDEESDEEQAKELPAPERNKERRPRRTKEQAVPISTPNPSGEESEPGDAY